MAGEVQVAVLLRAARRFERRQGTFKLEMDFAMVLVLVAQLQLALRHPKNTSEAAKEARKMVDKIISSIAATEPEAAEIMRQGDDLACDVEF